jgi:SAM-dependent methyltransferase
MTDLPALDPIPADIDEHLKRLLAAPHDPAIGEWLTDLLAYSGHLSTGDDMRWRVLSMVWLAAEYDPDAGWRYLQWLNVGQPVIAGHLAEILIEAIDMLEAHVNMANWLAVLTDPRLITFFGDGFPLPSLRNMAPLLTKLLRQPHRPETGVWLAGFCSATAANDAAFLRPWRLLTATWYAAQFNPDNGLAYLRHLSDGAATLSPADNQLLMDAAAQTRSQAVLTGMIAACPDTAVSTMLADFGHPHPADVAAATLRRSPDYTHLASLAVRAPADVALFRQFSAALAEAGITPLSGPLLNLACGPLAEQCVLFSSAGYRITGADLDIPPGYLPLAGVRDWFHRRKHTAVWQEATAAYYQALGQQAGLRLDWGNVSLKLADITRLPDGDGSFAAVICANLHLVPDVRDLLAEAARVLKPAGLLVANIRPYAGLSGGPSPWAHLLAPETVTPAPGVTPNKWRAAQFQAAMEPYFTLTQWQVEIDPQAAARLTPELRAALADYSEAELTCGQILVVAHRK